MDIFVSLKNLIRKINVIDKKAKKLSRNQGYFSNPFAFTQNKTYVWLENENTPNNCTRNDDSTIN